MSLRSLARAAPSVRALGVSQRFYSEAAPEAAFGDVQVTTLPNGITVATEDTASPASTVTVTVGAGSSKEGPGNVGVSHVMKEMAFQSTLDRTAFVITREAENNGLELSCTNGRDTVSYTASFCRDSLSSAVDNLSDAVIGQVFHPWEVAASKARVAMTLAGQSTDEVLADAVHAGAFRTSYGRAVFCPAYKVGAISSADLVAFADENFTGGNITVSGTGVDHATLVDMVYDNFENVPADDSADDATTYFGGFESRVESHSDSASYAIGFEGAAAGSDWAASTAVLAQVLGGAGSVKWGSNTASNVLGASVQAAGGSVSSFNYSYAGAGLVGVTVSAPAEGVAAAVNAAVAGLKGAIGGDISEDAVAAAKHQLARTVLDYDSKERSAFMASEMRTTKQPCSPEEYAEKLMAVTTADVAAAAAKAGASSPTVAATGNLGYAPFADELGL